MTLKEYLKNNGLTLEVFAAQVGASKQSVSQWANGTIPSQAAMGRIAEATGHQVRADDFYGLPNKPNGNARTEEAAQG